MKITLDLDEELLNEALQLTNLTTREELLNFALTERIRAIAPQEKFTRFGRQN